MLLSLLCSFCLLILLHIRKNLQNVIFVLTNGRGLLKSHFVVLPLTNVDNQGGNEGQVERETQPSYPGKS